MAITFYHVWFSTKGRKSLLDDEIGDHVRRSLFEIAERAQIHLAALELAADHVHLLVRMEGPQTLSSIMHQLKGASAREIFLRYPELKLDIGHTSFWQKGYGRRALTRGEVPAVRRYIQTHSTRPLRHNA